MIDKHAEAVFRWIHQAINDVISKRGWTALPTDETAKYCQVVWKKGITRLMLVIHSEESRGACEIELVSPDLCMRKHWPEISSICGESLIAKAIEFSAIVDNEERHDDLLPPR